MLNVVVTDTGPLFDLETAKQHLDVDTTDDDILIGGYSDAAVLSVLNATGRQLVPVGAEPVFRAAALLVLGDLYLNREEVIAGQVFSVSPRVSLLLKPYRVHRI